MFLINFFKKKFKPIYYVILDYKFLFGNMTFLFCKICEKCKLDKNRVLTKFFFGEYKTVLVMPVYNVDESIFVLQDLLPQIVTENTLLLIILNGKDKKNINKFSPFMNLTKNLKVKYDKRKLGSVLSFNIGIKFAFLRYKPSYIGFVSDHDRLASNWLRTLSKQLDINPQLPFSWATTKIKEFKSVTDDPQQYITTNNTTIMLDGIKRMFKKNKNYKQALFHLLGGDDKGTSSSMIYAVYRSEIFKNIGLIPYSFFPDKMFMVKIALRYGLPGQNTKTYREDSRSSKNLTSEEVILNQLKVVFCLGKIKEFTIHKFLRDYVNIWNTKEGKYLLKNLDYGNYIIFNTLHQLDALRMFSNIMGNQENLIIKIRK